MTRLHHSQIFAIPEEIENYDRELAEKTGMNLAEIGRRVKLSGWAGYIKENKLENIEDFNLENIGVAVIPITAGRGKITGFCEAVRAILVEMGFASVHITQTTDVSGINEALSHKAEVIFMADDNNFISFNTQKSLIMNNDRATARAYIEALSAMAGGISQRNVLVLGAGKVGSECIEYLLARHAHPVCYELKEEKAGEISQKYKVKCYTSKNLNRLVKDFEIIIDATPAADIITADMIDKNTYLAAPGIPAGFTEQAAEKLGSRLIHDPLQLGVAAMAFSVI